MSTLDLTLPKSSLVLDEGSLESMIYADLDAKIMDIIGFERGYNQAADVLRETVDGRDLNAMWREFQVSLRLFNSERDALLAMLTFDVSNPTETVYQPSADEDFEQATEFGEPKGIRLGRPFQMGYSFTWWDIGARYTWMFLAEADAAQVEAVNASVLEAGNRLYFSRALRQIFNPANTVADIDGNPYNVYALYNADGVVPPRYRTNTFSGTHTHYLASGAGTVDSGDLDDIEEHLYHHGYRLSLGYRLVLLVNRQEAQVIRGFRVASGDTYDFIPNGVGAPGLVVPTDQKVLGAPSGTVRNQIGTYGPWLVAEDDYIPAGYVLGFATGGQQNLGNLVGIRQHQQQSLRGLQLVKGKDNDYPLTDSFYRFGFGTGIRHRGAGVVMKITAGAYSTPTLYA